MGCCCWMLGHGDGLCVEIGGCFEAPSSFLSLVLFINSPCKGKCDVKRERFCQNVGWLTG